MVFEALPGIPFLQKGELVFILRVPVKIASPASLLGPDHDHKGGNRLGQLLALFRENFHSYDDQDHARRVCKGPANGGEKGGFKINVYSRGIGWRKRRGGSPDNNGCPSKSGGPSGYG
ncbi:MAG TPA: hypothetical protein VLS90_03820, partial [Thermodesulfobacteriota bacterium]|nr:hypothetical protein [Thermodesulfobacteriota bacterium]